MRMRSRVFKLWLGLCMLLVALAGCNKNTTAPAPLKPPRIEAINPPPVSPTTPLVPFTPAVQPVASTTVVVSSCEDKTYTVVKGDTLWGIALKQYGNRGYLYHLIADVNAVKNPDLIRPGQVFTIPCNLFRLPDLPKRAVLVAKNKKHSRQRLSQVRPPSAEPVFSAPKSPVSEVVTPTLEVSKVWSGLVSIPETQEVSPEMQQTITFPSKTGEVVEEHRRFRKGVETMEKAVRERWKCRCLDEKSGHRWFHRK